MRKSKYSDEQIIGFLNRATAGIPVKDLCRQEGFSEATRLRELEAENGKLKRLLAEAHLDMHALKSVLGVKR